MESKHLFSEQEKRRLTLSIFNIVMATEPERLKVWKARLSGTQQHCSCSKKALQSLIHTENFVGYGVYFNLKTINFTGLWKTKAIF